MADSQSQEYDEYLSGLTLYPTVWRQSRPEWDHEHCELCFATFSSHLGDQSAGFTTWDGFHWVCEACVRRSAERLNWTVVRAEASGTYLARESVALEPLERAAMEMLLRGDHPKLGMLRDQYRESSVNRRDVSGDEFRSHFAVLGTAPRLARAEKFQLGDVVGTVNGGPLGGGTTGARFQLTIAEGAILFLEGRAFGPGRWPWAETPLFWSYRGQFERDWEALNRELG